jgi:uncharacterized protein YqeY
MTLHDRLKQDLAAALAARDLDTAGVLRTLVAAIDNAAAVPAGPALGTVGTADVPRRQVSEDEAVGIVQGEADELATAIATYEAHDRPEAAAALRSRLDVVNRYLAGR